MGTDSVKNIFHCPHCGAAPQGDDDLCRFFGRLMSPLVRTPGDSGLQTSLLRGLKEKIRPLTEEEHVEMFEETTFNLSNPSDPIWDD